MTSEEALQHVCTMVESRTVVFQGVRRRIAELAQEYGLDRKTLRGKVTAGTHPWFADWDFPIDIEQKTVDEVLADVEGVRQATPSVIEQSAEVVPTAPVHSEEFAVIPDDFNALESQVTKDTADISSVPVTASIKPSSTSGAVHRETVKERKGWFGKFRDLVQRFFS